MANSEQLDKIDEKILYELSFNSRQTLNKIAEKTRLAKSSVLYRIKRLEELGVISGFPTLVEGDALGYNYGRVTVKLHNFSAEDHRKILSSLKSLKEIIWLAETQGKADLALVIVFEQAAEFQKSLNSIQEKIGKWIKSQEVSIASQVTHCAPNILFSKKHIEAVDLHYGSEKKRVSSFDKKLLSALANKSTITVIDLANTLKVSSKTVVAHKKDLEKKKIIKRYSLAIDPATLGLETYHIFWRLADYTPSKILQFKERLKQMKETLFITEALGSSNLDSEFLVRNQRELYELILKLREEFPKLIADYEFMLIYKMHKS